MHASLIGVADAAVSGVVVSAQLKYNRNKRAFYFSRGAHEMKQ